MTVFNYIHLDDSQDCLRYEWRDRRDNILNVPDDSWDPILDDNNGDRLREYLKTIGYSGPGDWNPY